MKNNTKSVANMLHKYTACGITDIGNALTFEQAIAIRNNTLIRFIYGIIGNEIK